MMSLSVVCGANSPSFDRYQTIVDRQMFGPLPIGFDPDKLPSEVAKSSSAAEKQLTQEQQEIKKAIRFMAINKAADGSVMVGFADFGDPKNPLTYYLKVGESQNGWTVREADHETAVMTIVNKDGVEVTLKLGGDSATDAGAVSKVGAAGGATSTNAGASDNARTNPLFDSLRGRRAQREAKAAAAAEKARAEREAEREKQIEADREERRRELQSLKDEIQRLNEARMAEQSGGSAKEETQTPKQEITE